MNRRLYPSRGLHGQVAHEIGRQIVSGGIAEGALLPREAELASRFDVSRQAVREALKVLAAKGLVYSRRRTGTAVLPRASWNLLDPDVLAWHPPSTLGPKLMSDLAEVRQLIEPAAAALAATRGDAEQLAAIGAALAEMRQAVADPEKFSRADTTFHVAVFAASGNELIDRLSDIIGPLLHASFLLQDQSRGVPPRVISAHEAVYAAILARDGHQARREMENLLRLASENAAAAGLI